MKKFQNILLTSAVFDVFQILPTESDVIWNFQKIFDKSFRIVIPHITSQNLVLIASIELKLSVFFDYDVVETDYMTCFFDWFNNIKISF